MHTQYLTESWAIYTGSLPMRRHDTPLWLPTRACGPVWRDLLEAGLIKDPAWRDNRERLERELRRPVTYRCVFVPQAEALEAREALLRICGLHGPARVELNGAPLGRAAGLRLDWEFNASQALRPGENCLTVELRPDHPGLRGAVELLGVSGPRVLGVGLRQRLEDGRIALRVTPELSEEGEFTVRLTGPDGEAYEGRELLIERPRLWSPRGYGEQPLYELEVIAAAGGRETDCWRKAVGLRTLTVEQGEDEGPCWVANGIKIFALGGILADGGPTDPEAQRTLVRDCALANYNCLRVPGGRCLSEEFYDECDRQGILVWQDVLPELGEGWELTPELARDIEARTIELGRRLGRHACTAIFCGGNGHEENMASHRQYGDYIRVYEYIVPKMLWKSVPEAPYWPSRPLPGLGEPGCSGLDTLMKATAPEDRRLTSRIMEGHMEPGLAGRMLALISEDLPQPVSFAQAVYASRLAQAWAVCRRVEALRLEQGGSIEAIVRAADERWPGGSHGAVDSAGEWKALQYGLKRSFAPLLLSCAARAEDEGCTAELRVINGTVRARQVLIRLSLRDPLDQVKDEITVSIWAPALKCVALEPIPLPEAAPVADMLSFELYDSGRLSSRGTALFVPVRHYPFRNPELSCRAEGEWVAVTARAYAKGVEISGGKGLLLSDNYFDMLPGERWVKVLRGEPGEISAHSAYDIGRGWGTDPSEP